MPNVTIDPNAYERFELKTAPPDGYVMLRPLPYGLKLTRRDKATKMMMRAEQPKRGEKATKQQAEIELETLNEWATIHDFGYCIGEHNLTDVNGQTLDFNNQMTFRLLNPKVGTEIEKYLADLNEDEDEESYEDFIKRSTMPSEALSNGSEVQSDSSTPPSLESVGS